VSEHTVCCSNDKDKRSIKRRGKPSGEETLLRALWPCEWYDPLEPEGFVRCLLATHACPQH
jgi:hypothetical protein